MSITKSELLNHFLHTNDTETKPFDNGDDNSIHTGDYLLDGAVDGGIWGKGEKCEMVPSRGKLYMTLRDWLN